MKAIKKQPLIELSARDQAMLKLGGFQTIDRLTRALDSELMRTLESFQEEKFHEALGFERFADFLDQSDISPMTRHQYYERKKVLDAHGDVVFDLMSGLSFPVKKQKMLGAGSVSRDGDNVVIKNGDDKTVINFRDKTAVVEALSALADANADKDKQITRGKSDLRRLQETVYELEESQGNMSGKKLSPLDKAHAVAVGGMSALIAELEKATLIHCGQYAEQSFSVFTEKVRQLNQLILEKTGFESTDLAESDDAEDRAAALLDDE